MVILPESKVLYVLGKDYFVIDYNPQLYSYFPVILCVISGYVNALLVTYQFAFQDFHFMVIIIMIVIDIIHLWNTFMELHTAYLNRFSDYVTDNKRIKRKYVYHQNRKYWLIKLNTFRYFSRKKKRIVDFIANTPFPYTAFLLPLIFGVEPYTTFSFLKLFTLLRIWDIEEFFNSRWTNLMVNRLILKLL